MIHFPWRQSCQRGDGWAWVDLQHDQQHTRHNSMDLLTDSQPLAESITDGNRGYLEGLNLKCPTVFVAASYSWCEMVQVRRPRMAPSIALYIFIGLQTIAPATGMGCN